MNLHTVVFGNGKGRKRQSREDLNANQEFYSLP